MMRTWCGALLLCLMASAAQGEPTKFVSAEHQVSVTIPDGWKQVAANEGEIALRISRSGEGDSTARITVTTYRIPPGTFPANYDVWSLTDEAILASGESGSVNGEAVKVLKSGRAEIDHHHMVWTLNRRTLPGDTTMWQIAYEGIRGSEGITVQLTVAGNEEWFAANESVFAIFIKILRLSAPKGAG